MSNHLPKKPRGNRQLKKDLAKINEAMKQALCAREEAARYAVEANGFTKSDIERGEITVHEGTSVFSIDGVNICEYTEPKIVHENGEVLATFMFKEL